MKPEVSIRQWSVVSDFADNPYQAPECLRLFLSGEVEDDKPYRIRSSQIVNLDLMGRRVETRNTMYLLKGPPDAGWVAFLCSIGWDIKQLPR
jgi:hypothetical protein